MTLNSPRLRAIAVEIGVGEELREPLPHRGGGLKTPEIIRANEAVAVFVHSDEALLAGIDELAAGNPWPSPSASKPDVWASSAPTLASNGKGNDETLHRHLARAGRRRATRAIALGRYRQGLGEDRSSRYRVNPRIGGGLSVSPMFARTRPSAGCRRPRVFSVGLAIQLTRWLLQRSNRATALARHPATDRGLPGPLRYVQSSRRSRTRAFCRSMAALARLSSTLAGRLAAMPGSASATTDRESSAEPPPRVSIPGSPTPASAGARGRGEGDPDAIVLDEQMQEALAPGDEA